MRQRAVVCLTLYWEVVLEEFGTKLNATRKKWGLSLREVEDRSMRLAEVWGNPSYRISASWLARVERGGRDLSAAKLTVLAAIFSIPADQLLGLYSASSESIPQCDQVSSPDTIPLLTNGPLAEQARSWVPQDIISQPIPDKTMLVPREDYLPNHYCYGVLGQGDNPLAPMIGAGSFLFINTQKRAIANRREWTNEFDRPIYFFLTHGVYSCGWCDLDKEAEWLTLVPHPLSHTSGMRWRYRKEVEVIGRIAAVLQRLEKAAPPERA
jgi:transcriptional regulator with XRE-family HTH domain